MLTTKLLVDVAQPTKVKLSEKVWDLIVSISESANVPCYSFDAVNRE